MANIASAIKCVRQNEKNAAVNSAKVSEMRTAIKRFETAVQEGADNVEELHQHAQKLVDQAVSKNLIHANKASRINSRMAQKLNK